MIQSAGKYLAKAKSHRLQFTKNNDLMVVVEFETVDTKDLINWYGVLKDDQSAERALKVLSYMGFKPENSSQILLLNSSSPMALDGNAVVELVIEMQARDMGKEYPSVKYVNLPQAERLPLDKNLVLEKLKPLKIFIDAGTKASPEEKRALPDDISLPF
jgi:hypothetical protein